MTIPQHNLQQSYQLEHQQQQNHQARSFRNIYTADGQISPAITAYTAANFLDQSQHPPYVPAWFTPVPVPTTNASEAGADLHWSFNLEPKNKLLKEQDFLENNSQISSVDFLQARSVSTGLGLSLDNNRAALSGDSALLSFIGDDIDLELKRQDAEIDRFLKVQGDRLRQAILDKVQASQIQTVSFLEGKILQKIRDKEVEVESINKKNVELEEQMERVATEANGWQQRARCNENMITALKYNLEQVYAQSNKDSKEGHGDSEVNDTASCCNGRTLDFQLLSRENERKELTTCKVCRVNEVSMLLLPCKHLCLCKDCESKLSFCPLCQSSKYIGMEVYM